MPRFVAEPLYRTMSGLDDVGLEVRVMCDAISLWTFSPTDNACSQISVHRTNWVLMDYGHRGHSFRCDVTGRVRKIPPGAVDSVKARLMNCSHSFSYDAQGLISYVLSITELADPAQASDWFRRELPNLFEEMMSSVTRSRMRQVNGVMSW